MDVPQDIPPTAQQRRLLESGGRAGYDGLKRESASFLGKGVWESNPPSTPSV